LTTSFAFWIGVLGISQVGWDHENIWPIGMVALIGRMSGIQVIWAWVFDQFSTAMVSWTARFQSQHQDATPFGLCIGMIIWEGSQVVLRLDGGITRSSPVLWQSIVLLTGV
jgi:hypothetical protein